MSSPARSVCRNCTRRCLATSISGPTGEATPASRWSKSIRSARRRLLELVLRAVCAAGARLAGPGEFTLRAFLAGRIDLTQAEAVLGVIDAARRAGACTSRLAQLAGGLARPLHRLRDALLDLLAHLEAGFDFADEDLAFITREELDRRLAAAENDVAAIAPANGLRGELVRRGASRAGRPAEHGQEQPVQRPGRPAAPRWSRTIPAPRATISSPSSTSTE